MVLDRLDRLLGRDNYQFLAGVAGLAGLLDWAEDPDEDIDEEEDVLETTGESLEDSPG
jgi:hypothetical protein